MTPGCDSRGRNDVRGRGGPSGGRWAGCGSTTSPTMQSSMAPSQVVLGGRKVAIRGPRVRRDGAELRIQRGALRSTTRRSSSMPGSVYGRSCSTAWITRASLWAVARIHPGIRRSADPTTDRGHPTDRDEQATRQQAGMSVRQRAAPGPMSPPADQHAPRTARAPVVLDYLRY